MSKFDNQGINNPALTFAVKNANTAPDGAYLTQENCVESFSSLM